MGTAQPLKKIDEVARANERAARLESKLLKCRHRASRLEKAFLAERQAKEAAELNAKRFHALLIQARVAVIRKRDAA